MYGMIINGSTACETFLYYATQRKNVQELFYKSDKPAKFQSLIFFE